MWIKNKSEADKSLSQYYQEKKRELEKELEFYKRDESMKIHEEIINLRLQCAKEKGDLEHDYHAGKEKRGIELAKIEALSEAKKSELESILKEKDETIKTLKAILEKAVANPSSTDKRE